MLEISIEEMEHFKMVHDLIKERGLEFERERKDDYVNELARYMKDHLDGSRGSWFN